MSSDLSRFDTETIKHAVNNAFPEELIDYHATIAVEIINLTRVLSHQYQREFPELTAIKSLAKIKITNPFTSTEIHKQSLTSLYRELTSKKQLEQYYFTAFISSVMLSPSQDQKQFEQYKAITLFVCAKLYMMGRHESAIKSVCNEIRQWSLGKRNELSNNLPDVITIEMIKLLEALDSKRKEKLEYSNKSRIGRQISNIYVPYNDCHTGSEGILRKTTLRDPGATPTRLIATPVENEDGDIITEIKQVKVSNEGWALEEAASDQKKSLLISMKKPSKNGYAVQKLMAQATSNRLLKTKMRLPCDIYQATNFEISTLLKYCMDHTIVCEKTRSFILASLTLGTSLQHISQRDYNLSKNTLEFEHILPTQSQRKRIIKLISPIQTLLVIQLPNDIKTHLLNDLEQSTLDKISNLLKHINKQHRTNLSTQKISNYLAQKLKQEAIDPTIIALIQGQTADEIPALSYTHLAEQTVNKTYQRFLKFLENSSIKFEYILKFDYSIEHEKNKVIGSPLVIGDEILAKFFNTIEQNISDISDLYSHSRHNLITYYVLFTLAISSGYRPVTGWLGKITDYNLLNHTLWISDKEMHQSISGRVIKIPEIAVSILEHYKQYLKAGKVEFMNRKIALSQRYDHAITGEEHLFFFITDNKIEEVTPKTMTDHFDRVLPLPLNWHRHYIRSLLVREEINPELIAAWMGHSELNEPAFTRFCSYSINDLSIISDYINKKLASVNCRGINFV
ncbi:hypothetical protein [Shewanella sp. UCD-KL21]|uniref:hypothetical protein n=1 Tax=Shewanella sp. UCD-KL21 TaxID=1917164 RepID=UPI0009710E90|nr:hypothetical protein [Shewanella sp. UCD-KL21]